MRNLYTLSKFLCFIIFLISINQNSFAQISGKVFRDFNADGTQTTAAPNPIEPGLKDVTVNAYDAIGTALTPVTTSTTGTYSITGGTSPYRVEFILPSGYYASKGNTSNTTVQFVATGGTANLGVNAPSDYCQANPLLVTPFHASKDGTTNSDNVLAKIDRSISIELDGNTNGSTTQGASPPFGVVVYSPARPVAGEVANVGEIGATWGLAYNKSTKKLYAASYIKRGTKLGPGESTGTIWVIDDVAAASAPASYVDLNVIFGTNTTGPNPHPEATTSWSSGNWDLNTLDKVGKVGLGDLEISKDGTKLYVVNLYDRKLYEIPTSGVLNSTTIKRYDIPTIGLPVVTNAASLAGTANAVDIRPFGLGFDKNGTLYVGAVHSAESISAGANTDPNNASYQMTAYVWKFVSGAFTLVLNEPLRFDRDNTGTYSVNDPANSFNTYDWEPWSNVDEYGDEQPLLTSIEFLDDKMVLGFRDRGGDQNYGPNGGGGFKSSGDIYLACPQGAAWKFEQNGVCGTLSSSRAGNNEGPGGGEFFEDTQGDNIPNSGNGGVSVLAGYGVLSTATDAVIKKTDGTKLDNAGSGGIQTYSDTNGNYIGGYDIYSNNTSGRFSKASGLGDLEILCDPQPIEIGNRVFLDTDFDGIQDANEAGLNSIIVDLYQGATKVGTTTTATINGQVGSYFFTNANVNLNGATGILPNTAYEIRIPNISGGSKQANLGTNVLTSANQGANDLIESDGIASSTNAIIALTTSSSGENNHSYDIGFFFCPSITTPSATQTLCIGSNGSNITVNTTQTATNGIKFIRFTSAQTGAAMYTGGTLLTSGTVTASGGVATYIWNSADFPNAGTTQITYYVYAILNPDLGVACQPFQEVQVRVNPLPSFTLAQTNVTCFSNGNGTITTTTTSGTSPFTYSKDDGANFLNTTGIFDNLVPATYKIAVKDTNGCVKKCN